MATNRPDDRPPTTGEILLYQTEDGRTRIDCRFDRDTVWLTQAQIAELFQTTPQNVTQHLKGIFAEGELSEDATCKPYLQVQDEGGRHIRRMVRQYRLEVVLAVGFRVRSPRGSQFRQWAVARLQEYLLKGFVLDDRRLKNPPGPGVPDYFDELLARIRDIRSSEKVFWRKVLDIYATSIDYDPAASASQQFFAVVQNKMHWAAHGQTAAELIAARADSAKPNMGLTSWSGARVRKHDTAVAKNYLNAEELDALNRIVTAYLEFAELRARGRRPMAMADWIAKLDDFLRLSEHDILTRAGRISHESATAHAEREYEKFNALQLAQPSRAERDFEAAIKQLPKSAPRKIARTKPPPKRRKRPLD